MFDWDKEVGATKGAAQGSFLEDQEMFHKQRAPFPWQTRGDQTCRCNPQKRSRNKRRKKKNVGGLSNVVSHPTTKKPGGGSGGLFLGGQAKQGPKRNPLERKGKGRTFGVSQVERDVCFYRVKLQPHRHSSRNKKSPFEAES